jgi:hypothetical protein
VTSTRNRIVVVGNRLEALRQVNSDGGETAWRVAGHVSTHLSLGAPIAATAQTLGDWTSDDWARVACLVFPSNSLRHQDSALHPVVHSLSEVVHTHSRDGMGIVMLHHFLNHVPLVFPEVEEGIPLHDHLVATGQTISILPDAATARPFLLPRKKLITEAKDVIAWKTLPRDPERLTPLAITDDGNIVMARSSGDVRTVLSTIPLDWWNEDDVLTDVMAWGAAGVARVASYGSISEGAGAAAPRWIVTKPGIEAWRADLLSASQPMISAAFPQAVMAYRDDMGADLITVLRDSNVTCMLFERSGDRFEVILPEPTQRLAEQHLQDLLSSRHELVHLAKHPISSLFGLRNILLANSLLEPHEKSLEHVLCELLTDRRISHMRANLCFDGMTLSSMLVATQIECLTRQRSSPQDTLRSDLDRRLSAVVATDDHTRWLQEVSLSLLRDQNSRLDPPALSAGSRPAADLRLADTAAFASSMGLELDVEHFEPVVGWFSHAESIDDAEALAATCRLTVALGHVVPNDVITQLEHFAASGQSVGARSASRAALTLVYARQPPVVVANLVVPGASHPVPSSVLTDVRTINALEGELAMVSSTVEHRRRTAALGAITSYVLACGLMAMSVVLVVSWPRITPLGPSLITPVLVVLLSLYVALGFLGWMNVLGPRVERLRQQFQKAIRRRLIGD